MKYCWSAALLMTTNRPPASPEPAASDPAGALALLEAAVDGAALLAGEHAAATIATLAIRMEIRCDLMGWNSSSFGPDRWWECRSSPLDARSAIALGARPIFSRTVRRRDRVSEG